MRASRRLPHALLLRGAPGVGKDVFARHLAASLLCDNDGGAAGEVPCGTCRGCRLFDAGSHPDALRIEPLEGKQVVSIEQVRELIDEVSLTARYAGRKVVVIGAADKLTHAAANTLLKTLEEPPGSCVFVLIAHLYGLLPATVRSRCQRIDFPTPATEAALAWLEANGLDDARTALDLAHGAPLLALNRAERGLGVAAHADALDALCGLANGELNALAVAVRWQPFGAPAVNEWLLSLAMDLIRRKLVAREDHAAAGLSSVAQLSERIDLKELFALVDNALDVRFLEANQSPLNEQLALDGLAVRWSQALGA